MKSEIFYIHLLPLALGNIAHDPPETGAILVGVIVPVELQFDGKYQTILADVFLFVDIGMAAMHQLLPLDAGINGVPVLRGNVADGKLQYFFFGIAQHFVECTIAFHKTPMAIHPNVAIHDAIIKSGKVVLSSLYFVFGVGLHLRGYEARKYILPVFAWQERGEQAAAKGRAIAARHIDRGKQQIAAARELPQESVALFAGVPDAGFE